jgi:hypothetical protein
MAGLAHPRLKFEVTCDNARAAIVDFERRPISC